MTYRLSGSNQASRPRRGWNARRLGRLACAHLKRGNLDLATFYAERAFNRWSKLPGNELNRADAAGVLAAAHDARGHSGAAIEVLSSAEGRLKRWGSAEALEHLVRLQIQHADVLRRRHHFAAARALYDRAINTLGSQTPARAGLLAAARNGRGIVAKDTQRYADAHAEYQSALMTATLFGDPALLGAIEHNLGGLAHATGHYRDGVHHAQRALYYHRTVLGKATAGLPIAGDLAVLGANLTGAHELPAARAVLSQAQALFTAHYGPNHYEVAVVLHNLAAIDALEGDPITAEQRCLQALEIKINFLGQTHPEIPALRTSINSVRTTGHIGTYTETRASLRPLPKGPALNHAPSARNTGGRTQTELRTVPPRQT